VFYDAGHGQARVLGGGFIRRTVEDQLPAHGGVPAFAAARG
jgi:hypothetical protein